MAGVKALRDELLNLANTQDINGNYIFSGNKEGAGVLENSSGVVSYNGDYGRFQINVSDVRRYLLMQLDRNYSPLLISQRLMIWLLS